MKKILISLFILLTIAPPSPAFDIPFLSNFQTPKKYIQLDDESAIKNLLLNQQKFSNSYNLSQLKSLYSKTFINADGFNYNTFFHLIEKTWTSYPNIQYKTQLKNLTLNGQFAIAEVIDYASATSAGKSQSLADDGLLESTSNSIYYLQKFGDSWLIVSDQILYEKTFLRYGLAKNAQINLIAPLQVPAGSQYSASLSINPPKGAIVIASIGKENITHPQSIAPEVFRKLPYDGILERVFKSNTDNINEYAVASIGFTKAEVHSDLDMKISVTGLAFVMTRVNVIAKNNFIQNIEQSSADVAQKVDAK